MQERRHIRTSQYQSVLSAWREGVAEAARTPKLMRQVEGWGDELFPRFAEHYKKLRALPRRVRRAMQRKWKRSLAGVALLIVLGAGPALAATINVGTTCTLVDAITTANNNTNTGGCVLSGAIGGADIIVLPKNSTQTLTTGEFYGPTGYYLYGPIGLPLVTSTITIDGKGSTIRRDSAAPDFRIFAVSDSGALRLLETTVSGGKTSDGVDRGGGVFNRGTLRLTNSTLSSNSTSDSRAHGGGVYNSGTTIITKSTLSGNSTSGPSAYGGGVYNSGSMTITNSTISGNSTSGFGSEGGGVFNRGALTITDSTISGNSTSGGSFANGGGVFHDNGPGTLTLTRTLVSGNTTPSSTFPGSEVFSLQSSFVTGGFNLFGHSGTTTGTALYNVTRVASDITATSDGTTPTPLADILETTLKNNGGPTQTHALSAVSPAIDAAGQTCSATDQRGIKRPLGAACDIGAFEVEVSCAGRAPTGGCTVNDTAGLPCVGTAGDDWIIGTAGKDVIVGKRGSDRINGLEGDDLICGGAGGDDITGDGGRDILQGGDGKDTLAGGNDDDELFGGANSDILNGGFGNDTLNAGPGRDTCVGGQGTDSGAGCETYFEDEVTF